MGGAGGSAASVRHPTSVQPRSYKSLAEVTGSVVVVDCRYWASMLLRLQIVVVSSLQHPAQHPDLNPLRQPPTTASVTDHWRISQPLRPIRAPPPNYNWRSRGLSGVSIMRTHWPSCCAIYAALVLITELKYQGLQIDSSRLLGQQTAFRPSRPVMPC